MVEEGIRQFVWTAVLLSIYLAFVGVVKPLYAPFAFFTDFETTLSTILIVLFSPIANTNGLETSLVVAIIGLSANYSFHKRTIS